MTTLQSTLRLSLLDDVTAKARKIGAELNRFKKEQTAFMAPLRGIGAQAVAFGAAYLGITSGVKSTVGAAISFESAFADVKKVLDGTDEQLANFRRNIIALSEELPISANGISQIYAAAAQSNIPTAELNTFAEMVAKVSTAWDVPVEETGQALAEIKNQLHLNVKDVGLFADSLNHLSNTTAANAPRLLEFTKNVASTGEMYGFTAQQTLAFGGAMIASGGKADVAATSFTNMGKALTIGTNATKSHRTAFKRLGMDSVRTAKAMQKDAIGTTLKVIDKIQELPEWERISIATALFGSEARALMPLINNSTELRRQLGLVSQEVNYAGSAFKEYIVRADTTGNVLQILKNRFENLFRGVGDNMLPTVKNAALGVMDVLDSLGSRVTIFDTMGTSVKGFMNGFGAKGDIRQLVNDIGDLLMGPANGGESADQLGRLFMTFKGYGETIRQLRDDLRDNPIVKFFGEMSPYALDALKWSIGFALLAGTIRKLASALMFLSGATALIGAFKTLRNLAGIVGGVGGATDALDEVDGPDRKRRNRRNRKKPSRPGSKPVVAQTPDRPKNTNLPEGKPGTNGPWGKVPTDSKLPPGTKVGPTGPSIPRSKLPDLPTAMPWWRKGSSLLGQMGSAGMRAFLIAELASTLTSGKQERSPEQQSNFDKELESLRNRSREKNTRYAAEAEAARKEQNKFNVLGDYEGRLNQPNGFAPAVGQSPLKPFDWKGFLFGDAARSGFNLRDNLKIDMGGVPIGGSYMPKPASEQQGPPAPVKIDADSLRQIIQPTGVQDVRLMNPVRPNVTVSASITINEAANGQATANEVVKQLGASTQSAVESSFGGGGGY